MGIEQKLCKVKIFQLQSMLNAIRCIDQRFVFKNSRILCLALIFNLKNPYNSPVSKKIGHYMAFAKTANRRKLAYEVVAVNLVNF